MTTVYIIPRVDVVGTEFREFIFGEQDRYKMLAWKCVDKYKACNICFSGIDKIFVINCYDFQILFISYIPLLTNSSSFFVQVQVS